MDTTKLKEALTDLEQQKERINQAIALIHKAISLRNGEPSSSRTLVDDAADRLEEYGKPAHIDDLSEWISICRGEQITRANLEASLSQHQKTANPRVVRVKPGVYGLPSFPEDVDEEPLTLDDDVPF